MDLGTCSSRERRLNLDKVAGFLQVGRTEDTHEVVILHQSATLDRNGAIRIVVSPRHARYLANLLTEHATCAEEEATGPIASCNATARPKNRKTRSAQAEESSKEELIATRGLTGK